MCVLYLFIFFNHTDSLIKIYTKRIYIIIKVVLTMDINETREQSWNLKVSKQDSIHNIGNHAHAYQRSYAVCKYRCLCFYYYCYSYTYLILCKTIKCIKNYEWTRLKKKKKPNTTPSRLNCVCVLYILHTLCRFVYTFEMVLFCNKRVDVYESCTVFFASFFFLYV